MLLFLFIFLITNILFSIIAGSVIIRYNPNTCFTNSSLILISFGLGPVLTSLILYYLLLLFPHLPTLFYLNCVLLLYSFLLILGRRFIKIIFREIKEKANALFKLFIKKDILVIKKVGICFCIICFIIISFLLIYFSVHSPLTGNDELEYGTLGKIYFQEKSLNYSGYTPYELTGFYMPRSNSPAFPMLFTWEKIIISFFKSDSDKYFKSIQVYYGLLIILLFFVVLFPKNIYFALLSLLILLSGISFYSSLLNHHLDLYRIYFLLISWLSLSCAVKNKDTFSLLLLGFFSGLAAFIHSIGFIMAIFNLAAFFIFLKTKIKTKLIKTGLVFINILIFGGIHYIIDIFWGSGWKITSIKAIFKQIISLIK